MQIYILNDEQKPIDLDLHCGGGRVVRRCCVSYITGASN